MDGRDLRDVAKLGPRIVGSASRTDRFGPLMDRYTLDNLRTGIDPREFWKWVSTFGVGYRAWFEAWQKNASNFLDVHAWGHDHDFGGGQTIKGTMDDRHVTNLERVVCGGGLDPDRDIYGKRVLIIGAYCGGEVLLLHALGAAVVDAVEEVPEYAAACAKLCDAFGIEQQTFPCSLYEIPAGWNRPANENAGTPTGLQETTVPQREAYDLIYCPGVVYHLTDQVAAMRILRDLAKPGGIVAFETGVSGNPNDCAYQGASKAGWNWWVCGTETYRAIMHDVGLGSCRQVEQVGGRAWFIGDRIESDPLRDQGCAGFSIPDLLGRRRGYRQE